MGARKQHSITILVLAIYVVVGIGYSWNVFDHVFRFGRRPYILTKSKAPSPPIVKVVWTQQKHYPSSPKDDIPAPAIVSDGTNHHCPESFVVAGLGIVVAIPPLDLQDQSPRAPPKV